jgi:hypothetical protein
MLPLVAPGYIIVISFIVLKIFNSLQNLPILQTAFLKVAEKAATFNLLAPEFDI